MIAVDKQDLEEIAALKWIDTKNNLVPTTHIESLSKTGKSFQPSKINHTLGLRTFN